MRKILLMINSILLLSLIIVSAHEHDFSETKRLIDSEIDCNELSDEQFEAIGDYYMEQMHPGEAHEMMDEMMGGEGSESLKQMHITMARRLYCNEDIGGMMGGGMMNMMGGNMMGNNMMQSDMMMNWGYGLGYWNLFSTLYLILLIGLIILVYLWIIKLWKNAENKKGKNEKR